jgi:hypothetical protein
MLLAFMGLEALDYKVESIASGRYKIPSANLPKMKRRKSEYLSELFGVAWWMGDSEYDQPGCENGVYNAVVWFLHNVVNKWMLHRPKTFWGNRDPTVGKKQFLGMLKHVLGRGGGGAKSRVDILDPNTPEGLRRFCTQGFASNFLTGYGDNGYAVDMRWMEDLRVRPGYHSYGGCVVLSKDLSRVEYVEFKGKSYYAGDREFLGVAYVFKNSVVLYQIGGVHGILVHMMVSNWVTLTSRCVLSPDHALRRLLAPFQIWTSYVDVDCDAIITAPGGIVDRGGAQICGDAKLLYRRCCETHRYETFPQELKRKGLYDFCVVEGDESVNVFPYGTEGLELWCCFEDFVRSYVDIYYGSNADVAEDAELAEFFLALRKYWVAPTALPVPSEVCTKQDLIDFATWFIWNVTAIHEHTGYVGDYFHEFDSCWSMLADGDLGDLSSLIPSVEDTLQVTFVHVLTTRPGLPLVQDFSSFFLDDAKHTVESLLSSLDDLHYRMEERNKKRTEQFKTFDPYSLEISVAV